MVFLAKCQISTWCSYKFILIRSKSALPNSQFIISLYSYFDASQYALKRTGQVLQN